MPGKNCAWCNQSPIEFAVEDEAALRKLAPKFGEHSLTIPPPTLCAECRQQRRFWFRNDQNLYRDNCRLCQKAVVTNYAPPKEVPVLCEQCFWGDGWDPLKYGREFDFNRPFFEQFLELKRQVPRLAIYNTHSENSQYTVHSSRNKNCYWSSSIVDCEEVLYSDFSNRSQNSLDLFSCQEMELCYECLFSSRCYNTDYAEHCHGVIDSFLCFDCRASNNLLGCVGLRSKSAFILNQPATTEQVRATISRLKNEPEYLAAFTANFEQLKIQTPRPPNWTTNVENCNGNYQTNCKNLYRAFNVLSVEDGRNLFECYIDKDLYDCTRSARSEMLYECSGAVDLRYSAFCVLCYQCDNLLYCDNCQGASNCFGSMSLKKQRYCVLNRAYSQAEYERLVPRIVEHMRETAEWGEFFPPLVSPFWYNETKAADWYPLTEGQVSARGGEWGEYEPPLPAEVAIVDPRELDLLIAEVKDSVLSGAVRCKESGKPFRIVPLELEFYLKKGLRIPNWSPRVRHRRRIAHLAGRLLHERFCERCGTGIATAYSAQEPELVYCEACYLEALS